MSDTTHLVALHERLHREKTRLSEAKTDKERALRTVWVSQIEKEIAGELEFLGMAPDNDVIDLSDDELLVELQG